MIYVTKLNKYKALVLISASILTPGSYAEENGDDTISSDLGYFYGYSFGNMLRDGKSEDVDLETLMQGLKDSLKGQPPVLDAQRREAIFVEVRRRQMLAQAEQEQAAAAQAQAEEQQSAANLKMAEAFLTTNGAREGVVTTSSGLQYEVIEEVAGPTATFNSRVTVRYKGMFTDGEVFDQSGDTPVEFGLGQVISGWTEALQLMSVGDKYKVFLHPALAYGAGGVGDIPGNAALVFDIELVEIK